MAGIYLRHDDSYVAMTETEFDSEDLLQALIGQHPEILVDESAGQGRLLLVQREAGIREDEYSGNRYSLDHLYVDSAGVPTLVEVKRSSDTRLRREVVAPMLDYAANAGVSFTAESMAGRVDEAALSQGGTGAEILADQLGVEDPDEFWETVGTNLQEQRFRLVFVSDVIPQGLRNIIEFLNDQMTRTDVLAIEVKQYVDANGQHQTIVPQVIGNTEKAKAVKRNRGGRKTVLSEATLLAALDAEDPQAAAVARALLQWAREDPRLQEAWNRAGDIRLAGRDRHSLLRVWPNGDLQIAVKSFVFLDPSWDDEERLEEFVSRLESILGDTFTKSRLLWPTTQLKRLADQEMFEQFTEAIIDVVVGLKP